MADIARDELVATLKGLFVSGQYSDFEIVCGSDIYKVHKAVVCSQSRFFKNAENFPVGRESAEGSVNLPDDDPVVIKLLICFFYEAEYEPRLPVIPREDQAGIWTVTVPKHEVYTYGFPHTCREYCDYEERILCPHHNCCNDCNNNCKKFSCKTCTAAQPPEGNSTQMLLHAKMYAIGDKYDIPALRHLATEKFERACTRYWDDEQFPIAAAYVLETTSESDKSLRDIVHAVIVSHRQLLSSPAMEMLLIEHSRFAVAVARRLAMELDRVESGG